LAPRQASGGPANRPEQSFQQKGSTVIEARREAQPATDIGVQWLVYLEIDDDA
jgi:hypothetical protein